MEVVSNEFRFAILRKWIYELQVPLYELQSNFTNCKFVLPVGNKIMSCKLFFASCELLFMSYKFRQIVFRVASCVLWIENLKFHFKNLKFHFKCFTSWKVKTIMFTKLLFTSWTFQMPTLQIIITFLNQISRK